MHAQDSAGDLQFVKMTKLKTLKDLDMYKTHKKLLKREGIKWVKENEGKGTNTSEELVFLSGYCQGFIDFFNITEEDLK